MSSVPGTTAEAFESLWTADDVARFLQASRSWVYQKAEAGVVPALRVCGLLRFEPAAVRAFARGELNVGRVTDLAARRGNVR
jgi:hypothetical protein